MEFKDNKNIIGDEKMSGELQKYNKNQKLEKCRNNDKTVKDWCKEQKTLQFTAFSEGLKSANLIINIKQNNIVIYELNNN